MVDTVWTPRQGLNVTVLIDTPENSAKDVKLTNLRHILD